MPWDERKIETALKKLLTKQLGAGPAGSRFAEYQVFRDRVIRDVAAEFRSTEPELSDHGPEHIADVLDRAYLLLADTTAAGGHRIASRLNCEELYLLCEMIVFHDVGNMFGRKDHHKNIAPVFDWVRGKEPRIRPERSLVLLGAKAHTGTTAAGSLDTLADVPNDHALNDKTIRLRDLAAVLRLADELAEGPHRTSGYKLSKEQYSSKSTIYHEYASITRTHADRGRNRLKITYEINVDALHGPNVDSAEAKLKELLAFTYSRVVKLDQERRYARYYSPVLLPYNETSVVFNFHTEDGPLAIGLAPVIFDDKVIPGDGAKNLADANADYEVSALVDKLKQARGNT